MKVGSEKVSRGFVETWLRACPEGWRWWYRPKSGKLHASKKTDSLNLLGCKFHIKWCAKAKVLSFDITKEKMHGFVFINFYGFTFVTWATIWLTSKIWPLVNQFFGSLYMDKVFALLLYKGIKIYLDDILIHNKTTAEHVNRILSVLQCLENTILYCNPKKCKFDKEKMGQC